MNLRTSDFDYPLPEDLIAQFPAPQRSDSRMMLLERSTGNCEIRRFRDLPQFLEAGDGIVFNNTKVVRARFFGIKEPGGAGIEILLISRMAGTGNAWLAMIKPGRRVRKGTRIRLCRENGHPDNDPPTVEVLGRSGDGGKFVVLLPGRPGMDVLFSRFGHIPLPPYISRSDRALDSERYQTVYAKKPGAVAAPTAGLHFSPEILGELDNKGVSRHELTLHVGPGTFRPVDAEEIGQHKMHSEHFELSAKTASGINRIRENGKRVLAVGTTVLRTLESCADSGGRLSAAAGETEIFIHPPREIKSIDMLLTNFHLPRSTLLMLVCALAGTENTLRAYAKAVDEKMRFYSYGDCMLVL